MIRFKFKEEIKFELTPEQEVLMDSIREKLTEEELELLYWINLDVVKQTQAILINELSRAFQDRAVWTFRGF